MWFDKDTYRLAFGLANKSDDFQMVSAFSHSQLQICRMLLSRLPVCISQRRAEAELNKQHDHFLWLL